MGLDARDFARLGKAAQQQILNKLNANAAPAESAEKEKKENKYHARKVEACLEDGTPHTFDSTKELDRYRHLVFLQRVGEISDLQLQVKYELIPKQRFSDGHAERALSYVADFVYKDASGNTVVEDVKGYRDPASAAYRVFVIKRKLMLWVHGIEVKEV